MNGIQQVGFATSVAPEKANHALLEAKARLLVILEIPQKKSLKPHELKKLITTNARLAIV